MRADIKTVSLCNRRNPLNINAQMLYSHTDSHLHTCTYICSIIHSDTTIKRKKDYAGTIKMQEGRNKKTSLEKYSPLSLFVRFAFERMLETEHKLHILTPLLWPSRCVLFSWCWGPLHQGFPRTPRSGVAFPTTSGLYSLGFDWQLLWDPNSTELNNNSTPTQSPTGSLNRMFNRHQAEITVMQFRGHSLPLHDCNGRMGPSPCPIS